MDESGRKKDKIVVAPMHVMGEGRELSDRSCTIKLLVDGKIIIGKKMIPTIVVKQIDKWTQSG